MKHFLVEITYLAPLEAIDAALAEHRAFLQTGYEKGMLLCSGPLAPRTGAVVVARAESAEVLQAFFRADPFQVKNLARYRIAEFQPVKHQAWLADWVAGR